MKRFFITLFTFILIFLFSTLLNAKDEKIFFATGGLGGVYFYYGTQVSDIITKTTGYKTTAIQTAASVDNNLLIRDKSDPAKGTFFCATSLPDSAFVTFKGTHPKFKDNPAPTTILWMMYPNFLQIVTTDKSGIKSLADLSGKRVSTGAPGSGTEYTALLILESAGVKTDSFKKWEKLGAKESEEGLSNGTIDAYFWSGGLPTGSIVELTTTLKRKGQNVAFVPIPKDSKVVQYFNEKFPGLADTGVIKKDVYGTSNDTETLAFWNQILAPKSLPEDVAYNMVKAVFSNLDQLHSAVKASKDTNVESTAKFIGKTAIPFHPGAIKYFKEIGAIK